MKLEHRDCIRNARALDPWAIDALLNDVPGWTAIDGILLPADRVAQVAETQDHHPELTVGHATCRVSWTTHSAGGALTENDFICAAKVNALYLEMTSA